MRKKLLSLLTVLCLVLGMLPTTALAAATEAYENNEVARVITVDTEITEDVDGLVVVDAPCTVTVTDAKLSVGIVVSPDAAGAVVELKGSTESAEVVVLAAASVKVEKTANAGAVTVDAAEAELEIAGTAEVALTENATDVTVAATEGAAVSVATAEGASATVTAAEGASVTVDAVKGATVAVDAAKGAEVSVAVAEGATATVTAAEGSTVALDVAEGAEVAVDVAEGAEVAINGDGAESVEVTGDGAESVTVNGETAAEDEENKEDEENTDDAEEAASPAGSFVAAPVVRAPRIQWATLAADPATEDDLVGAHSVSAYNATELENGGIRANVNISAKDLTKHTNGNDSKYWIGFGIPMNGPEDAENKTYNQAAAESEANKTQLNPTTEVTYKLYVLKKDAKNEADNNKWACVDLGTQEFVLDGDQWFQNLYFGNFLEYVEPVEDVAVTVAEDDLEPETEPEAPEAPVVAESKQANKGTQYVVVVTSTAKVAEGAANEALETPADLPNIGTDTTGGSPKAGEEIVYVFDVTIDATLVPAPAQGGSGD